MASVLGLQRTAKPTGECQRMAEGASFADNKFGLDDIEMRWAETFNMGPPPLQRVVRMAVDRVKNGAGEV